MTNGRVEVITSVERRRRWSSAEKQQLVAASLEPGSSVSAIAEPVSLRVLAFAGTLLMTELSFQRESNLGSHPRFLPAAGPIGMRSTTLMGIAVRVMGNLVTDDDVDWVARVWRAGGLLSRLADRRKPFT